LFYGSRLCGSAVGRNLIRVKRRAPVRFFLDDDIDTLDVIRCGPSNAAHRQRAHQYAQFCNFHETSRLNGFSRPKGSLRCVNIYSSRLNSHIQTFARPLAHHS
jgi:hypothetical protein